MRSSSNKPSAGAAAGAHGMSASVAPALHKPKVVVDVPEPEFVEAELVVCLDESKLHAFGRHAGVVVSRCAEQTSRFETVYMVRVLRGTLRCVAPMLADIQQSAFPLAQLPAPVLALVLYWLPLGHAAVHARVSRKFAAAFRDNVSWKRRCVEQVKGIDVEAVFATEKESSWMAFYRRHAAYYIRIVTVFTHSNATTLSGEFKLVCEPRTSVEEFLELVRTHPSNRQRGAPRLRPHDPRKIGNWGWGGGPILASDHPAAKPNCVFHQDHRKATIAEAGLCNGAVLEQPEY